MALLLDEIDWRPARDVAMPRERIIVADSNRDWKIGTA